jgi:hypothetical protein
MGYVDPDLLHSNLDSLITYVEENSALLTTKGLNPATIQTNLTTVNDDLTGKKGKRDAKKTELTTLQQTYADSAATNYTAFSNAVDIVAGALGKETPAGKQVLHYRKNVTGANHHASPAPAPASVPAK